MTNLARALNAAQSIAVLAHLRPDGDAVGSVCSASLLLRQLGKEVVCVLHDGVPPTYQWTPGAQDVVQELPTDLDFLLVLDTPDALRSGFRDTVRAYGANGKLGLLDHHRSGDLEPLAGPAAVRRQSAASTTLLVAELARELGARITPDIATALYLGLATDTANFKNSATSEEALLLASDLVKRGADRRKVVDTFSMPKTAAMLRLSGIALSRASWNETLNATVSVITDDDRRQSGHDGPAVHGVIPLLEEAGSAATILLIEESGVIRGQVRSNGTWDASEFTGLMGGGGHARAAGFEVPGRLVQTSDGWRVDPPLVG